MGNNDNTWPGDGVGDYLLRMLGLKRDDERKASNSVPEWMTQMVSGPRGERQNAYIGGIRDGADNYYRRFNPGGENANTVSNPGIAKPVDAGGSAGYWPEQASGNAVGRDVDKYDPQTMHPSDKLVKFIADYEEFRPTQYKVDGRGNLTIGYGHEILPGENFDDGITEEQAKKLLLNQMNGSYAPAVRKWAAKHNLKLTQPQFDALVSFVYNMGVIDDDKNTPTLSQVIRSGSATPEEVRNAFGLYITDGVKIQPGLTSRRRDEADMYLNGDYKRDEW